MVGPPVSREGMAGGDGTEIPPLPRRMYSRKSWDDGTRRRRKLHCSLRDRHLAVTGPRRKMLALALLAACGAPAPAAEAPVVVYVEASPEPSAAGPEETAEVGNAPPLARSHADGPEP